jgi:hypothetical protein
VMHRSMHIGDSNFADEEAVCMLWRTKTLSHCSELTYVRDGTRSIKLRFVMND